MAESPRLSDAASSTSYVRIEANDDANGILELSTQYVTVAEGSPQLFLSVVRSAGNYGEVDYRQSAVYITINDLVHADCCLSGHCEV